LTVARNAYRRCSRSHRENIKLRLLHRCLTVLFLKLCVVCEWNLYSKTNVMFSHIDRQPTALNATNQRSVFYTGAATIASKWLLNCTHEAEWTPFQIHYFSENLVAPGMEPWPLDL
jgi:hypothetical protein